MPDDPDTVLAGAFGENFEQVVVVGRKADGRIVVAATEAQAGWDLLEAGRQEILRLSEPVEDPDALKVA